MQEGFKNSKNFCIWITGLLCSGKASIAKKLAEIFQKWGRKQGRPCSSLKNEEINSINRYENIIKGIYKKLLLREVDHPSLQYYSEYLNKVGVEGIPEVVRNIIDSAEFFVIYTEYIRKFPSEQSFSVPEDFYSLCEQPVYIIIHIPKTAGISLRLYLYNHFKQEIFLYVTGGNSKLMAKYPLYFFLEYKFIMGHFDYDFIRFIPRKEKFLITFLREPLDRLWSHYRFMRFLFKSTNYSNSEELPHYILMKDSYELPPKEFFKKYKDKLFYNYMSKLILGHTKFQEIINKYNSFSTEKEKSEFLEEEFRPLVQNRLEEFFFIGLFEDFEASLKSLIIRLGAQPLSEVPKENITKEKLELTMDIKEFLEEFITLDRIVYEEGKKLYYSRFKTVGR